MPPAWSRPAITSPAWYAALSKRLELTALGIAPVIGSLDDAAVLTEQAHKADAVINAASSDHRAAVETLLTALQGSNKPFLHTSGSSIVGDASGGKASDVIYFEDNLPEPTVDKAARVAIDNLILAAAQDGVNSAVICNTLILRPQPGRTA